MEESDGLIRTFNALLMIARAESGQARGNMDDFDAADVARDIQELYEAGGSGGMACASMPRRRRFTATAN